MQSDEQFNIGYIRLFSISSSFLEEIDGLDGFPGRLVTVKGRIIRDISNADENDFVMVRSLVLSLREIYSLLDSESRGTVPTAVLSHVSVCIKYINAKPYDTISSEICGDVVQALFELLLLSSPPDGIDTLTHVQYVVSFFAAVHNLSTKIANVDGKMMQQLFIENAKSWSPNIYREIVDELIHISFPAENYDQAKYIEALACLITLDGSEHYEFLVKKLPLICCSLVLGLRKIASSKLFLKILNALESILKEKSSLVSQFVFGQMSLFLVLSTSRSGPSFADDYDTDELYLRLCSVTSTILLSFRKFLRGHHNLVIRLLQNLLYPLFVPRASSNGRIGKSIQYHWKRPIWMSTTSACSTSCALAYSRLISNLCEPPSRSKNLSRKERLVSHDRLSYSLSSAAGNSRRALSKHTPYLLVEYCYATLNYTIEPATRQALMQGIYTLFDSLGQNELNIVNAALDVAGRAIFKSVYDDYLKFGKWHDI
ncbi:Urb2/Npa2 family-domain-containing protein [Lipomyces orientalis]|uniref:Urb2/Npa2 family-domain-containing protein n=1 Tax=Lipomyces orientalis TaxID=1233043 RepID=A0ACC3THW8_9ASCO